MMNTIVKTGEIIEKVPMLPRQSALWIAEIKGKPPRSIEGERERERDYEQLLSHSPWRKIRQEQKGFDLHD